MGAAFRYWLFVFRYSTLPSLARNAKSQDAGSANFRKTNGLAKSE